jgi:hypothetical protein
MTVDEQLREALAKLDSQIRDLRIRSYTLEGIRQFNRAMHSERMTDTALQELYCFKNEEIERRCL